MKRAVILCGLTGYAFIVLLNGCAKLGQEKSVPPVSRPPSEALAEYSMAVRSGMEGDADAVIKHYKSAIKEDPDNTDLKTELALILLHQGDFNGTVAVSDEIIALDRRNIKAYQMKALALRIAGRKEDSLLSLESAAAIKPKEAQLHIDVAGMLVHMKESRKAISYLEKKKHLVKDKQKIEEALGELYTAETRIALASKQDIPAAYLDNMKAASREYPSNEKILILCGELLVLNG